MKRPTNADAFGCKTCEHYGTDCAGDAKRGGCGAHYRSFQVYELRECPECRYCGGRGAHKVGPYTPSGYAKVLKPCSCGGTGTARREKKVEDVHEA